MVESHIPVISVPDDELYLHNSLSKAYFKKKQNIYAKIIAKTAKS